MNAYVKYGLIFVGGAAVGGGVGWFTAKKHYEGIMDERIQEENQKTREYYDKKYEGYVKAETDVVEVWQESNTDIESGPDSITTVANDIEEVGRAAVESYTERMNRRKDDLLRPERIQYDRGALDRISYNSFSKPKIVEDIEEKEVDEVRLKQNDYDPRDDIYVISAEQFAHERLGFDKVTLYWWELERILSEEDMAILDVPDILGTGWEGKIGTEEKDVVYVRNENLETDYEVVVQHNSFYQMRDS